MKIELKECSHGFQIIEIFDSPIEYPDFESIHYTQKWLNKAKWFVMKEFGVNEDEAQGLIDCFLRDQSIQHNLGSFGHSDIENLKEQVSYMSEYLREEVITRIEGGDLSVFYY